MKRLSMRKIREALRLSFEGLSTREMALSLAIGRTTLREYLGRARCHSSVNNEIPQTGVFSGRF